MYIRKTADEYNIMGNYGYGHNYEIVNCETTYRDAIRSIKEYRENEPGVSFKIVKKRVKI